MMFNPTTCQLEEWDGDPDEKSQIRWLLQKVVTHSIELIGEEETKKLIKESI